jgi:hypothetical protein
MAEHKETELTVLPNFAHLELKFKIQDDELIQYKTQVRAKFNATGAPVVVNELLVHGVCLTPSPYIQVTTHWGIEVNDQIFHLVFEGPPLQRSIKFHNERKTGIYERKGELGSTKYSMEQLLAIGDMLIACFGTSRCF